MTCVPSWTRPDPNGLPELSFALYDAVWRLDHATGRAELGGPGAPALARRLGETPPARLALGPLSTTTTREQHARRIGRILDYITAGDVYQVNLTHALTAAGTCPPAALYAALRRFAAPFGGYLDLGGGAALVANSPERFMKALSASSTFSRYCKVNLSISRLMASRSAAEVWGS